MRHNISYNAVQEVTEEQWMSIVTVALLFLECKRYACQVKCQIASSTIHKKNSRA